MDRGNYHYTNLTNQETPYKTSSGITLTHRLRVQEIIGKTLNPKHPIHHFELNNYLTLIICEDQDYHFLLHLRQRAFEASNDPHKRKCGYCSCYDNLENLKSHGSYHRTGNELHWRLTYYHNSCAANYTYKRRQKQKDKIK